MNIKSLLYSSLFKTFFWTFLVRILAVGLTFISSVLLARTLGVEDFGIYSYVFALVSLLALPAQAGMPTLVLRETSQAKALGDWSRMKGIWLWASYVVMIISFITFTIAVLVQKSFFLDLVGGTSIFAIGLIMSLLVAMGNVRGAALRGLGLVIQGQLPEGLIRPLFLTVFILVSILLNIDISSNLAMLLHLVAAAIAFIVGTYLLIKAKPKELKAIQPIIKMRAWFYAVMPLAIMTGIQSISGQIDILMLGALGAIKDVGIYKVIVSGAALVLFGLQVVSTVITPQLASAFAKKSYAEIQKLASIGSFLSFCFTLPLVFIIFFWGEDLLKYIYGNEYVVGYRALFIIAIGQAINAFFGSSISILTMSGNERFVIQAMFLSAIINAILNFILIPKLGVDGAAIGASVSMIIWNLYLWIAIRYQTGIDSTFIGFFSRKEI